MARILQKPSHDDDDCDDDSGIMVTDNDKQTVNKIHNLNPSSK
jgi:hypothetical protein